MPNLVRFITCSEALKNVFDDGNILIKFIKFSSMTSSIPVLITRINDYNYNVNKKLAITIIS